MSKFVSDVRKIGTNHLLRFLYAGTVVSIVLGMYIISQTWKSKIVNHKRWWPTAPFYAIYNTVFFVTNAIFNWTVGSYIYRELPLMGGWKVKFFFTKRTQYYINNYEDGHWKRELADFTAIFLNRFDKDHVT